MIMNKQKSYKGWDFLDTCSSEQLNLLKEVLFIDDKKKISIDLTDGEWKRMERKVGNAENGGYPPTQNGDIRSLFWLFSLMALQN